MSELIAIIPNVLVDLLKDLTKNFLRDKPENIYIYALQYFEKRILERDGSPNKGYEIFQNSDIYFSKRSEKYIYYLKQISELVPISANNILNKNAVKIGNVVPTIKEETSVKDDHNKELIYSDQQNNKNSTQGKNDVSLNYSNIIKRQYNNLTKFESFLKNSALNEAYYFFFNDPYPYHVNLKGRRTSSTKIENMIQNSPNLTGQSSCSKVRNGKNSTSANKVEHSTNSIFNQTVRNIELLVKHYYTSVNNNITNKTLIFRNKEKIAQLKFYKIKQSSIDTNIYKDFVAVANCSEYLITDNRVAEIFYKHYINIIISNIVPNHNAFLLKPSILNENSVKQCTIIECTTKKLTDRSNSSNIANKNTLGNIIAYVMLKSPTNQISNHNLVNIVYNSPRTVEGIQQLLRESICKDLLPNKFNNKIYDQKIKINLEFAKAYDVDYILDSINLKNIDSENHFEINNFMKNTYKNQADGNSTSITTKKSDILRKLQNFKAIEDSENYDWVMVVQETIISNHHGESNTTKYIQNIEDNNPNSSANRRNSIDLTKDNVRVYKNKEMPDAYELRIREKCCKTFPQKKDIANFRLFIFIEMVINISNLMHSQNFQNINYCNVLASNCDYKYTYWKNLIFEKLQELFLQNFLRVNHVRFLENVLLLKRGKLNIYVTDKYVSIMTSKCLCCFSARNIANVSNNNEIDKNHLLKICCKAQLLTRFKKNTKIQNELQNKSIDLTAKNRVKMNRVEQKQVITIYGNNMLPKMSTFTIDETDMNDSVFVESYKIFKYGYISRMTLLSLIKLYLTSSEHV